MANFQIIDLVIYPVKSLGGITVDKAEVTELGFKYDRQWMLVDPTGRFISQREIPQMALLKCSFTEGGIKVNYTEESVTIPFRKYSNQTLEVSVWDHNVIANEVDPDLSNWFSNILNTDCRLVTIGENYNRIKEFMKPPFNTNVSFADGYPYLILGSASLDLLNSKLSESVPYNRFRPNIYVRTNDAHEEDNWKDVEIGSAELKIIKPCARCTITTIDQSSGSKGKEPLKTLSTYRKEANGVMFGANAMMLQNGIIHKNDHVVLR